MKTLLVIFSIILIIALAYIAINNKIIEGYSSGFVSKSIEETKSKNVFIKTVKVNPSQVLVNNSTIKFKECWVQERTQIKYKWLFFKTVKKLGLYYICFNLTNPISDDLYMKDFQFKSKESKYGFASTRSIFYYDDLKSLDIKEMKVELLENMNDKTEKLGEVSFIF